MNKSKKRDAILRDPLLGEIEDVEMARRHGVCHATAWKARRFAGIPCRHPRIGNRDLVLAQRDLGEVTDSVIAERLGVSDKTVGKYRNEAGITPLFGIYSHRGGLIAKPELDINDLFKTAGWL